MADTMVFALIGSLIITLTLLPVLCAWFMRKGVRERRNKAFEWIKRALYQRAGLFAWRIPGGSSSARRIAAGAFAAADPVRRRGIHAAAGRRRAVGARHHALHHLL